MLRDVNQGDDNAVRERIAEPSYYRNFLALAAKIAPDGELITGVGFTARGHAGKPREVELRRAKEVLPTEPKPSRPRQSDQPDNRYP